MVELLTGAGAPEGFITQIGHHPEVTVVLPVFRNQEALIELYDRLRHVMESNRIQYEILFVDDASPDNSLDVLIELAEIDSHVAVLALERNVGQQRTVMAGLSYARGEWVVVMDADLQDPPEAIPELLAELRQGPDAVFAGRRGRYESSLRLLTSRLFKRLLHHLCGVPVDAGIFVAMNRQVVERLLAFDDPHPFVVAQIGCTGLPVVSVPVERSERWLGRSSYSFWKRLKVGCLAIARIPIWKYRNGRPAPERRANDAKVKAYIGNRFDLKKKELTIGMDTVQGDGPVMGAMGEGCRVVGRLRKLDINEHNLAQRQYFERSVKATMVPRKTRYLRRHVDEMVRFAGLLPGMRVLEVGCGMGRYTLLLAELGLKVEGLDLSRFLLEKLSEFNSGRYNILLHCGDIMNPPPELGGKFDAIIGFFTLHHLHDLTLCFKAMVLLVKPGGRIVFLEPNPYNLLYYIQIMITPGMTWRGDGGIVRMRPRIVLSAMGHSGLGRLAMARFGFFPPFLANHPLGAKVEAFFERMPVWRTILPFQIFRGERV